MDNVSIFYGVLPIILVAFLGNIIKKSWITSDEFWRGLEKLSFYVLFPAMLFKKIFHINIGSSDFAKLTIVLIVSISIIAILMLLLKRRYKYHNHQFSSMFQGAVRYNNYLLFALSFSLFGEKGLAIVSGICPYTTVFTNVISIMALVSYKSNDELYITTRKRAQILTKSVFTNPFIIASVSGFIANYLQISINPGVEKTLQHLSDSALAIGILIVGARLKFDLDHLYLDKIIVTAMMKLIAMPFITYAVLSVVSVSSTLKSIGILFSCLPCSSSSYLLSRQLGGDAEMMSSIITFSVVFSIFSLSILSKILL